MTAQTEDEVASFVASMPAEYRAAFDPEAMRSHAEIVGRRTGKSTHVEMWRALEERIVAICVVAEDRPGLLSSISSALVSTKIDVVSAHAYCRTRTDGAAEAIDVLWIRRLPDANGLIAAIRAREIVAVADAIERAVKRASLGPFPVPAPAAAGPGSSTRIRFDTDPKTGITTLTVEAVDRPGLLLAVTQALFRAGLQIIGLRATTERGCAVDRFQLAEADGSALRRDRLLTLQTAILGALDEGPPAKTLVIPKQRSVG